VKQDRIPDLTVKEVSGSYALQSFQHATSPSRFILVANQLKIGHIYHVSTALTVIETVFTWRVSISYSFAEKRWILRNQTEYLDTSQCVTCGGKSYSLSCFIE
jgi:hypothetical protein